MVEVKNRPASPEVMALAEAMMKALGQKTVGSPTTNYVHGPGGIFGVAGLERDLISTRVKPMGLVDRLPARPSIETNPLFPYYTGNKADTGDEPDGVCDDPPVAGLTKACIQTAQFGRVSRQTKAIEVNRVGQIINRGEFLDLTLINDPILQEGAGLLNMSLPQNDIFGYAKDVLLAMIEVGISFQNKLYPMLYAGDPSNNTGGGYAEFPGLDLLIGSAKYDALTGTACPSLASDVKDFNYGLVSSASPDIVQYVTYLFRYLKWNAQTMGLDPATWVIAMRPDLFYELTAVWPCSYLTWQCSPRSGNTGFVDTAEAIRMRDNMRNGSYLLIDGQQVEVVMDTGIHEDTDTTNANVPSGQFSSSIYFIPVTVRGGFMATYMQYLDYSRGTIMSIQDGRLSSYYWTDGGRFLWHAKPPNNWCSQWLAKIEPRVILHTPQLAGKIQNVRYAPLQHTRDPFPSDPYFVNGGVTSRDGPSLYSDWNAPS